MENKGWNRLACAIVNQAVLNWHKYVKILKKTEYQLEHPRNDREIVNSQTQYDLMICELRDIIVFIRSDWFKYLTNSNASPKEAENELFKMIPEHKQEILDRIR